MILKELTFTMKPEEYRKKFSSSRCNARNSGTRTFLVIESYQLACPSAGLKFCWRLATKRKYQLQTRRQRERHRGRDGWKNQRLHDMAMKGPTHRVKGFGTSGENLGKRSFVQTSFTRNFSVTAHCLEK